MPKVLAGLAEHSYQVVEIISESVAAICAKAWWQRLNVVADDHEHRTSMDSPFRWDSTSLSKLVDNGCELHHGIKSILLFDGATFWDGRRSLAISVGSHQGLHHPVQP
ncbi:hypothetical protein [Kineococcus glutinatus]|uniref:hypothetical protein n=1 Tax=Kineococcus glutinatus TaxID=1070872 RepID=UPI0031E64EAC